MADFWSSIWGSGKKSVTYNPAKKRAEREAAVKSGMSRSRGTAPSFMEKSTDSTSSQRRGTASSKMMKRRSTAGSKMRGTASSMGEKYPDTASSKKREKSSALTEKMTDRKTSSRRPNVKPPASEKPVSSVKTKGGDYKVYKKDSAQAKSFRAAYAAAKADGRPTFPWNGKVYSTK